MDDAVLESREGPVLRIIINRPERRNALNADVMRRISDALTRADADGTIRVVILTAAGDMAFCAGADLSNDATFDIATRPRTDYADMFRVARQLGKPIVARVNGACMAGGIGLLCLADIAVTREDAKFGLPEVKVGLFPMQVLAHLQHMIPDRVLRSWCLTGASFGAGEALQAGLVSQIVAPEQLDAAVDSITASLIANSPAALRRGKYALSALADMTFEQRLAFAEGQIGLMAGSPDAVEGIAAFGEKRLPKWKSQ